MGARHPAFERPQRKAPTLAESLGSSYDPVSEKYVIGGIFKSDDPNREFVTASHLLKDSDFTLRQNRLVFSAMQNIARAGLSINQGTVTHELLQKDQMGAVGSLTKLIDEIPTIQNVEEFCKTVAEHAGRRHFFNQVDSLRPRILDEPLGQTTSEVAQMLSSLSARNKSIGKDPRGIETITADELYSGDYAEPVGIIDKLLYPGVTMLQGAPKSGKSYLALQASLDLVNGWAFMGRFRVNRPCSVLYADLEDNKPRTKKRLRQLGDPTDRLRDLRFVYSLEAWPSNLAQLGELLAAEKTNVLIIDTLVKLRGTRERGSTDVVGADYAVLSLIRELSEKYAVACLVIHHTKKNIQGLADTDSGIDTTGTIAGVDTLLTLRHGKDGTSMLSVLARDVEPTAHELEFDLAKHHGWRILASGAEAGLTAERREIIELLKQEGPLKPKAIADSLGKKGPAVRRLLMKLTKLGSLRCDGKGSYSLNPESLSNPVTEVTGVKE